MLLRVVHPCYSEVVELRLIYFVFVFSSIKISPPHARLNKVYSLSHSLHKKKYHDLHIVIMNELCEVKTAGNCD